MAKKTTKPAKKPAAAKAALARKKPAPAKKSAASTTAAKARPATGTSPKYDQAGAPWWKRNPARPLQ